MFYSVASCPHITRLSSPTCTEFILRRLPGANQAGRFILVAQLKMFERKFSKYVLHLQLQTSPSTRKSQERHLRPQSQIFLFPMYKRSSHASGSRCASQGSCPVLWYRTASQARRVSTASSSTASPATTHTRAGGPVPHLVQC